MYIFGAHTHRHAPDFETQIKRECVLHLIITYSSTASAGRGRGKMILRKCSPFFGRSSNGGKMGSNERKTAFTPNLQGDPFTLYIRRKNLGQRQQKYVNSVKEREGETELPHSKKQLNPTRILRRHRGRAVCDEKGKRERKKTNQCLFQPLPTVIKGS